MKYFLLVLLLTATTLLLLSHSSPDSTVIRTIHAAVEQTQPQPPPPPDNNNLNSNLNTFFTKNLAERLSSALDTHTKDFIESIKAPAPQQDPAEAEREQRAQADRERLLLDRLEAKDIAAARVQRGRHSRERSHTGRLSVDYDLRRMRTGAVAAHSFMPPLLQANANLHGSGADVAAMAEGGGGGLAYWELGQHAVATDDYVRLTPAVPSRRGVLWNQVPMSHIRSWSAHIGFRVHGESKVGADGFAFWYQTKKHFGGGPIVGMTTSDLVTDGVGVIFDTFDNDRKNDNPAVYIVKTYGSDKQSRMKQQREIDSFKNNNNNNNDAASSAFTLDPQTDYKSARVAQCYRNFRNTADKVPVNVVVRYDADDKTLLVAFADQHCAIVQDVELPIGGYFGFSAETGGASDNHDIHYFILLSNDDDLKSEDAHLDDANNEVGQETDDTHQSSVHSFDKGGFNKNAEDVDKKKWTGFDEKEM